MSIMEQPTHIVCPKCGMVSHHPRDIQERYCVNCHGFHDDLMAGKLPTHCFSCGVFLMGGATQHKNDCAVRKLIEEVINEPKEAE